MGRLSRVAAFLLLVVGAVGLAPAGPVAAHAGSPTGGRITLAQDVGPYPLTVSIEQAAPAAPLRVVIAPDRLPTAAVVALALVPLGGDAAPEIRLPLPADDPSPVSVSIAAADFGLHELLIEVTGAAGTGNARIPFEIATPRRSPASTVLRAALVLGGALLMAVVALVGVAPRRRLPRRLLPGMIGVTLLCLTVAAAAGAQQALAPPTAANRASGDVAPRPYANMVLRTFPDTPVTGEPMKLLIDFSDGATGRPVDDLVPDHQALLHGVVVSNNGASFAHLHPARIAPGRYQATFSTDRPGPYTFYAEISRRGSGGQVITRPFLVTGPIAAPPPTPAAPVGRHEIGDLLVEGSASTAGFEAGRPTTLTFRVTQDGRPVAALQPWLGMPGHLLIRGAEGTIFGHVHATGESLTESGDAAAPIPGVLFETTTAPTRYEPTIQFTYTPPVAGSYRLWLQFKVDDRIITLPLALTVAASEELA